jgi:hypothetical protein
MVDDQPKENALAQPVLPKSYDLSNTNELISLLKDEDEAEIKVHLANHLQKLFDKANLPDYRLVLLYDDEFTINQFHSNQIYEAVSKFDKKYNILMVIVSDGGKIEPAYLISKTCKRLSKSKFVVSVPRKAKSAATLICLGADEIHMGLLSELGPIDPQFGGFPALGLANALEKITALSSKFPNASEMFAKYLTANLNLRDLGYFERINESAAQYAQRLLQGKTFTDGKTAETLADHFTNHYKDHGFVIDADEASHLLGVQYVKEGTKEYEIGNDIYRFFQFFSLLFNIFKSKTVRYVGSIENGFDSNAKKEKD